GMAFGSPGNNFYEILDPSQTSPHDCRVQAVIARETCQLQFSYGFSAFRNDLDVVRADNPCFGLTAAVTAASPGCGGDATGAPERGQTALTPNNTAHTFALGGGVSLPWWRTHLSGNVSYSLRLQDQSFQPQTRHLELTAPAL